MYSPFVLCGTRLTGRSLEQPPEALPPCCLLLWGLRQFCLNPHCPWCWFAAVEDESLDELGILPIHKRHRRMLVVSGIAPRPYAVRRFSEATAWA